MRPIVISPDWLEPTGLPALRDLPAYLNQPDALDTGSVTRNRVPVSGVLLTSMRPSCASTILRTIASPSPVPVTLVVKNGLKMRSVRSAGMPGPSSATSIEHRRRRRVDARERRVGLDRAVDRRDRDPALAVHRLEGVGDQVGEHLRQLVVIALDHRQAGLDVVTHRDFAARRPSTRPSSPTAAALRRGRCARPAAGPAARTPASRRRSRWRAWLR